MELPDKRLIYHIDVNSAFLSWESVHRLRHDPNALDLRTIPSAVGGDRASRHGVVLAKSTPAKAYGIITGEPLAQALKKCPQLVVVPSHFDIYLEFSENLLHLLEEYTPDIEKFSIDEAFLDMTSTIHLFGDPFKTAALIRERIKNELGFTVNIGISSNKLLAKMASDFEKPDRCHTLWKKEVPIKMWPLPVRDLFFVGNSAEKKMKAIGIRTIGDLAHTPLPILKSHLGEKYSAQIFRYANGIDDSPVEEKEPVSKGYSNETTLSQDIDDYDNACQVILSLCETIGIRLRKDKVQCNCLCVELKDWTFHAHSHQMILDSPTDSTTLLYQNACKLLKEFWDLTPIRLISVRASHILDDRFTQLDMFHTPRNQKLEQMDKAIDAIREKYGIDSIKRASFLKKNSLVDHASSKQKLPPSPPTKSDNQLK